MELELMIENYYKSLGIKKEPKVKKPKGLFDGLITVYMQHETQKVL